MMFFFSYWMGKPENMVLCGLMWSYYGIVGDKMALDGGFPKIYSS